MFLSPMMDHMTLSSSPLNQVQDSQVNDTSEGVVIHRLGGRRATKSRNKTLGKDGKGN